MLFCVGRTASMPTTGVDKTFVSESALPKSRQKKAQETITETVRFAISPVATSSIRIEAM
jgi:hypothetical protein